MTTPVPATGGPRQPVSASVVIHAPAEVVFDIVADAKQHARIDGSGSVRDAVDAPDRLSMNARFGMRMKIGAPYRTKNKVVEFEEGRVIAWRHIGRHRWRYQLEPVPDGGGTRVTETWDTSYYPRRYARALGWIYTNRTQRSIEATLVKLKAAAEADAAAGRTA